MTTALYSPLIRTSTPTKPPMTTKASLSRRNSSAATAEAAGIPPSRHDLRPVSLPNLEKLAMNMLGRHPEIRRRMSKQFGGEVRELSRFRSIFSAAAMKSRRK